MTLPKKKSASDICRMTIRICDKAITHLYKIQKENGYLDKEQIRTLTLLYSIAKEERAYLALIAGVNSNTAVNFDGGSKYTLAEVRAIASKVNPKQEAS